MLTFVQRYLNPLPATVSDDTLVSLHPCTTLRHVSFTHSHNHKTSAKFVGARVLPRPFTDHFKGRHFAPFNQIVTVSGQSVGNL